MGVSRRYGVLGCEGEVASLNRIAWLMAGTDLRTCRKAARATKTLGRAPEPFRNHLARDFAAMQPNTKWVVDITCIRTGEGWLYLRAVLDLYSGTPRQEVWSRTFSRLLFHRACQPAPATSPTPAAGSRPLFNCHVLATLDKNLLRKPLASSSLFSFHPARLAGSKPAPPTRCNVASASQFIAGCDHRTPAPQSPRRRAPPGRRRASASAAPGPAALHRANRCR